ncbi:hypothetical protein [Hyalangium rubrum]|uniref:Uncharacterized protein n=1 Tax=Hyalangium rubrum TaxID=3103134 RepID=A0ABU5HJH5_9BACT|nr:hypothetical protein [Hyalangium sp. s54d21]MDY7232993.1 hypothetical protein [Hyalangium sp. s54d21]
MLLPYVVPSDWPAQIAASEKPFGALPRHTVGEDWFSGLATVVLGKWNETTPVPNFSGPGTVGGVLDFELYSNPRR